VDVDETRESGVASQIDDRRAGRDGAVAGSDLGNPFALDHDDGVLVRLSTRVDESSESNRRDLCGRARCRDDHEADQHHVSGQARS